MKPGVILMLLLVLAGCGANENILKSGKETPAQVNTQPAANQFARDLQEFRTADFNYVYVLRRKDGGPIDSEDRGVIRLNTQDANRRVSADDGRAFIIGSNPQISPQNMMALYARFAIENYSPDPSPTPAVNGNTNKSK